MAKVIVQIYGIRSVEDARMVIDAGGDHLGVSYGSIKRTPGQLDCEQAKAIFDAIGNDAVKVGLTVAEDIDEISDNLNEALPDVLHLSGDIDAIEPEQIRVLRKRFPSLRIMQAIPVLAGVPLDEQRVLEYVKEYEPVSDFFLIDTKAPEAGDIGATGLTHDRSIDKAIIEATEVPCIIAGGLDEQNVAEAIAQTDPYGVDSFSFTNYSDERGDGLHCKDPQKVLAFVQAARDA
ncbi:MULTISPECIES: phosphoribosylanthranilate isomerase [Bifidobacterium]|uniref:N-(5'-phosphoribosyl)anthranilate isomerase n=1 Tax=Bifidobacterium apousia TaxID=2750996 RepID=A0A556R533_9BIFI|nr:phosphoribosylanthranilate isomerase [Bifidobacterium apousia]MBI0071526.1 phosphoribosylanthranilate isomerase [Bifidobacterium sp. W8112]MBI0137359.1 phosphoribosylanthranilate isomerase [Bifidobacterium sp. W8120]MBI0062056.1 phosphoribosylanthranilate isomerase [Bifidobacterium apousia]MBI0124520.1 phosphoribosylanthranilate isomerase [Bifidobacterium apousia]TSJ84000.1 phosphoribosylanthranilate isomerase [Bifidobacterium apousia]